RLFGPVMAVWFAVIGFWGLREIIDHPDILRAVSPSYAVTFFAHDGTTAFLSLAAVVLTVTGAEALYADMGHFGRAPIRRAWFVLVLPALVLNYMGQGALLISDPSATQNPFFHLVPDWAQMPMVLLATAAAVIASQAVISGAFSVTRQAVQLGFLPPIEIRHTSARAAGQIYVPGVNWALLAAVVGLVVGFGSSTALAAAYGVAVTGTLAIDTILFFVVVRVLWRKPVWMVALGAGGFLLVDLSFLVANLPKVPRGGWFPLAVGLVMFTVLMTWRRGREVVTRERVEEEGPLRDFVLELAESDHPPLRVPGTAVYLDPNSQTTPLALRYNVEHNHILHEHVVVFTAVTEGVPHVSDENRVEIDDLIIPDDGIVLVTAHFGFQDQPDVPAALRLATEKGLEMDVGDASYFLSRVNIEPTSRPGMARWRKRLFARMARNAADRGSYFKLPEDRVVSFGSTIEF
ncbi:MAG: system potassium uptake protein, partial [Thermoleophilaceae bacterium]|nr:system potassium uptake protein [Thermoleophilaceae bacterium]